MSKLLRTIFFWLGLLSIVWMLVHFDLDLDALLGLLKLSGLYFPLALLLWLLIYALNTCSWRQIIRTQGSTRISWWRLYKFTVSGFALNYVTPGGLNGGEPYRILALRPYLGTARASSSTILYALAHVGSHLIFWLVGAAYMACTSWGRAYLGWLVLVALVAGLLLVLFHYLMSKGVAQLFTLLLRHLPGLGKYIRRLEAKHGDTLQRIDQEVREAYCLQRSYLLSALGLEFFARLVGCLEVLLLLMPLLGYTSFIGCYLIMAIASLMGNLLFFMPMQLGGREGGFSLALSVLNYSASYGLVLSLLVRLRELVWIVIGVSLIQLERKSKHKKG